MACRSLIVNHILVSEHSIQTKKIVLTVHNLHHKDFVLVRHKDSVVVTVKIVKVMFHKD